MSSLVSSEVRKTSFNVFKVEHLGDFYTLNKNKKRTSKLFPSYNI